MPITDLQKFYHTYYQPDNAVLIVAGNFDAVQTLAYIQRVFGVIPRPTRVLPNPYTVEPPQDGEREVTLRRTGGQLVLIESSIFPPTRRPTAPRSGCWPRCSMNVLRVGSTRN